jgi:hypothetical protein
MAACAGEVASLKGRRMTGGDIGVCYAGSRLFMLGHGMGVSCSFGSGVARKILDSRSGSGRCGFFRPGVYTDNKHPGNTERTRTGLELTGEESAKACQRNTYQDEQQN